MNLNTRLLLRDTEAAGVGAHRPATPAVTRGLAAARLAAGSTWFWLGAVFVVGLALWLPYALRTTFAYDDWAYVAKAVFHLDETESYRPGNTVAVAAMTSAFGSDPRLYYLAAEAIAASVPAALLIALRHFGVSRVAAVGAAALLVVMPRDDSVHLWWTASPIALAVTLGLLGVAAAGGFVAGRRGGAAWLVGGMALIAAAVLTYEATAVLVLLPLALLAISPAPRRSLVATAALVAAAVPATWYMYATTNPANVGQGTPRGQWPARFGSLVADGWRVFVGDLPGQVGVAGAVAAVVTATAVGGAVVVRSRLQRRRARDRRAPVERVGFGHAGAVAASIGGLVGCGLLAFAPFVPANAYYTAGTPGVGNRVNVAAAVFFVAAAGLLAGELLRLGLRRPAATAVLAAVGAGLLGGLLAVGTRESLADAGEFAAAARLRQATLAATRTAIPHPASGTTVLLGDYARYRGSLFVPILAATWDTLGAVRVSFGDPTLSAAPLDPGDACTDAGLVAPGSGAPVAYATLRVVDVDRATLVPVVDAASCTDAVRRHAATFIDPSLPAG